MTKMNWEVLDEESRRRAEDIGFRGRIRKTAASQQPQPLAIEREYVAPTVDYSTRHKPI